jgi:hypothetical protein
MATFPAAQYLPIAEALRGSGGFADGTALVQYASETDEQYKRRRVVAWYVNALLPACQRFVGYIAKKPPMRETQNPLLTAFLDDCNWRGDSLDVFWQGFMVDAKARGAMLLLVDMPRTLPADAASQIQQRAFPYLVPILPEHVIEYRMDARGMLEMIEIGATDEDGSALVRGWDTAGWWVRKGEDIIDAEPHPLGACPVLAFSESGEFPDVGSFADIAGLSRRIYNLRSELDEILRRHTFPVFAAQFPILDAVENETPESLSARQGGLIDALRGAVADVGKNRGIVTPGIVAFIAPPDGPVQSYRDTIGDLEAKIKEVGLSVDLTGEKSAESGLALTIRFQALNAALMSFSRRMEDLERRALNIACIWLGLNPETITTQWARDYQLADLAVELETLGAMQASGFPEEAISAQMKQVAQLALGAGDPSVLEAVMAAIDAGAKEVTP